MNMNAIVYGLSRHYQYAEKAEKIVVNCALTAACAVAVGGVFPVLALPATIISSVGAVWAMYIKLCKCLDIPIGENLLKVLATAALSNIAANLIGVFAVELLTAVVPGIGSVAGAAATFGCVYLAGMMFMRMILAFAEKGVVGDAMGNVKERDLKAEMKRQTPTKEDAREARSNFDANYGKNGNK